MADDLDDLDALLQDHRPDPPATRSWPLAVGATVVIIATLMWIAKEVVEWFPAAFCGGWFLC
jgi:hypothetical protein